MTSTRETTAGTSARLVMLSRLMWALFACAVICAIAAAVVATHQPSADTCAFINQQNQQLGMPAVSCGNPAGQVAAEVAVGVFFGLGIITRIVYAFVSAGITDRASSR
jgi:hypothetical protein